MPASTRPVVYLCAEFGVESDLPIYAGGLGILAGDTLKAAVDAGAPYVGIGLLYQGERSHQTISADGWQEDHPQPYNPADFGFALVKDNDVVRVLTLPFPERTIGVQIWVKSLGPSVQLYLLDPNIDMNPENIRACCRELYCCDDTMAIMQAFILGTGGYALVRSLGIEPRVYHFNEGRPAFLAWPLLADLQKSMGAYEPALQAMRNQIVYTNHTLLLAGNMGYDQSMIFPYAQVYAEMVEGGADRLLALGENRVNPTPNKFSITELALNVARKVSGVSQPHTKLAQRQWPQMKWVNITNGVHLGTWQKPEFARPIMSAEEIWQAHNKYKAELVAVAQQRTGFGYDPQRLVVGWARRMTGYKRPSSLFTDIARLNHLARNAARPVQIVMAGTTHPNDESAKKELQSIIKLFQTELSGIALYIPDYDIALAQALVAGCDIWLNTPQKEWEACGTSGMKAVSNGVLQCTVASGWAAEVDWSHTGWELDDSMIAHDLYEVLENKIIPEFYTRNEAGLPLPWISRMQQSILLAQRYSATRMLAEYRRRLY